MTEFHCHQTSPLPYTSYAANKAAYRETLICHGQLSLVAVKRRYIRDMKKQNVAVVSRPVYVPFSHFGLAGCKLSKCSHPNPSVAFRLFGHSLTPVRTSESFQIVQQSLPLIKDTPVASLVIF